MVSGCSPLLVLPHHRRTLIRLNVFAEPLVVVLKLLEATSTPPGNVASVARLSSRWIYEVQSSEMSFEGVSAGKTARGVAFGSQPPLFVLCVVTCSTWSCFGRGIGLRVRSRLRCVEGTLVRFFRAMLLHVPCAVAFDLEGSVADAAHIGSRWAFGGFDDFRFFEGCEAICAFKGNADSRLVGGLRGIHAQRIAACQS